ncbi:MAG: hypothetical protein IM531_11385 [Pseudanabaena sp. M090S1SP1A06QC]|nr:hypothetical protein [Pseudanabaena sp. M109S1SP2A07QC]MCA6615269.1 hypothetical protein [Pseudanabaena sp. M090S1SP1A06QC]
MFKRSTFFGTIISISFLFGVISVAIASEKMLDNRNMPIGTDKPMQFKVIDQPLINKILVTVGGMSLIGAELWWFLVSKPKSK